MKFSKPLLVVFLLALVFQIATVSSHHSWGDDFAQYILHARNIAKGTPYADTGYLQNPVDPALDVGPRMYPPLMPLVLAPVYRLAGASLPAMKYEQAVLLVLAVLLAAEYFVAIGRVEHSRVWLFFTVLAFHPVLWESKESIGSDLLFLMTLYGALFVLERILAAPSHSILMTVLLGVVLYACIATRTIGIVMVPVVLTMLLLHKDRGGHLLLSLAVCGLLMGIQALTLPSDNSYLKLTISQASLYTILRNVIDNAKEFSAVWKGFHPRIAQILYLLSLPVVAWGAIRLIRPRITALALFALGYTVVILVWPYFQGMRYLLPLLPIYMLCLWTGAASIHRHGSTVAMGVLLLVSAGYYWFRSTPVVDTGVTQPAFQDLVQKIQEISEPGDPFLFRKPRALALMANRPAAVYNSSSDEDRFWDLIEQLHIRYVVKADLPEEDFRTDREILGPVLDARSQAFPIVYSNGRFTLYRVEARNAP